MYHYPSLLSRIYSTLCIDYSGNVWCIGSNSNGELGFDINENKQIFPFKQLSSLTNIKMISCSRYHTICLNYDGEVFSFGKNSNGELGIGKTKDELEKTFIPQKIQVPSCKQVSCGENFTLCLSDDGYIYSFGKNTNNRLGLGTNRTNYYSPQLVPNISNVEYIVCGDSHVICKTSNMEYFAWGSNTYNQLGYSRNISVPDNSPYKCTHWPDNIIDIKCGAFHTLLLTDLGQVYSCGSNSNGQIGCKENSNKDIPNLIQDIPEVKRISCGEYYSLFIDIDNNLWGFGSSYYGQLGLGDYNTNRATPIKLNLENIMDISYGGRSTFIKTYSNEIYSFGSNSDSQLGIKTKKERIPNPIQILKDQEDIWCSFIGKSRAKSARK